MDEPAAPRIKAERSHEAQPIEQGEQVLLTRRLGEGPQPGEAGLPDGGIDGEQLIECGQFLGREAVEHRRLHPPARDDPCGTADPVERIGSRKHRLAFPEGGDDRFGGRHSLVGYGGGRERRAQGRPSVLTNGWVQTEMPLRFDRMLAPGRVAPAILGQGTRVDINLLGEEGNHRCRRRFARKNRPAETA
jgi:hypothetical protein